MSSSPNFSQIGVMLHPMNRYIPRKQKQLHLSVDGTLGFATCDELAAGYFATCCWGTFYPFVTHYDDVQILAHRPIPTRHPPFLPLPMLTNAAISHMPTCTPTSLPLLSQQQQFASLQQTCFFHVHSSAWSLWSPGFVLGFSSYSSNPTYSIVFLLSSTAKLYSFSNVFLPIETYITDCGPSAATLCWSSTSEQNTANNSQRAREASVTYNAAARSTTAHCQSAKGRVYSHSAWSWEMMQP